MKKGYQKRHASSFASKYDPPWSTLESMHESDQISSRPHTGPSPQKVSVLEGKCPAISPGNFGWLIFFIPFDQGDTGGDTNPNQDLLVVQKP